MLKEALVAEAVGAAFRHAQSLIPGAKRFFSLSDGADELLIRDHLTMVDNWSAQISFFDLPTPKELDEAFIDLDISDYPRRTGTGIGPTPTRTTTDLLNVETNIVLLGDPGAGKTTTTKYICRFLLHNDETTEGGPSFGRCSYPLLVRCRDLGQRESLFGRLGHLLGITQLRSATSQEEGERTRVDADRARGIHDALIKTTLDQLAVAVFVDGLDELPHEREDSVVREIEDLSLSTKNVRILVTSRSGGYKHHISNAQMMELRPLTETKIHRFSDKWLPEVGTRAAFLESLKGSPYSDTAVRPLTLAHLCAIYEKYGHVPEKPKSVYRKLVNLLLEEWDAQRGIRRKSRYSGFEADRKADFLASLAYELTSSRSASTFTHDTLERIYRRLCRPYGLPERESAEVAKEIESHTGLIVESDYDKFEFAHRSLQEYLCAEHLNGLPVPPESVALLERLPNELAIAVSLSSEPTEYLYTLVVEIIGKRDISLEFRSVLLRRICLERPDFAPDPTLAIALLVLETSCIDRVATADEAVDDLVGSCLLSLRSLSEWAVVRESLEHTRPYYGASEEARGAVRFSRKDKRLVLRRTYNPPSPLLSRTFSRSE